MQPLSPIQEELQRAFKGSLYLTAKFLCGFNEKYVTGPDVDAGLDYPMNRHLHGNAAILVQYLKWIRLLFLMGRGTFKSSLMSVGYPTWKTIKNQNIRGCLAAAGEKVGKPFIEKLASVIDSPLFRMVFPNIHLIQSSTERYTVNRTISPAPKEATMTLITVGSSVESAHYDYMVANDLVNEKNSRTATERERVIDFGGNLTNLLADPNRPILVEGTTWDVADWYAWLRRNRAWLIFRLPIRDIGGQPTFVEKYPEAVIQALENEKTPKDFAANYLLNPVSGKDAFMSDYPFRYYTEGEDNFGNPIFKTKIGSFPARILGTLGCIDTATYGGQDLNCIMAVHRIEDGKFFVPYAKLGHWNQPRRLRELEKMDDFLNPYRIGMEEEAEKTIASAIGDDRIRGRSRIDSKMYPLKSRGKQKTLRVAIIEPYLHRNEIFFHEGISPEVINQIRWFPEYVRDDSPDTLAWILYMFDELRIKPKSKERQSYLGERPLYPQLFGGGF